MDHDEINDILASANPPIDGLREIFAMYCRLFGLSQQTCLGLILMLYSRWALLLMIIYFYQAEERGDKLDTTDVVLMAEKVRRAQDKRKALGLDPDKKKKNKQFGMIYLSTFNLMSEGAEDDYLQYHSSSVYDSIYPMRFFTRPWKIEEIEFSNITIFCGSNGSGKSTLLNAIAEKLNLKRDTPYNKTAYFEPFVDRCSYDLDVYDKEEIKALMEKSRIITSDDVFRHIISVRKRNEEREFKRDLIRDEKSEMALNGWDGPIGFNTEDPDSIDAYLKYSKKYNTPTSKYLKGAVGFDERTYSNGENGFKYFTDNIQPGGLYLLDEPENSLSADLQMELVQFLVSMARFYDCQFILATHSPFLLSIPFAHIYNMDEVPVKECKWTELPSVRLYHDFFKDHESEFI